MAGSGPHADAACMPDTDRSVGIDLGLTHFAVLADGSRIDSPRFLRRAEKRNASAVAPALWQRLNDNYRSLEVQFDAGGSELVSSIDALLAETYLSIAV